jgi:N-acetylmuramoyl-L-alanine amidase
MIVGFLALAPLVQGQAIPPGVQPPASIVVTTPRGETRLGVRAGGGAGPSISSEALVTALNGSYRQNQPWLELTIARQSFDFLIGAPFMRFNDRTQPLSGWAWAAGDSLFLPLQFVTEMLPQLLAERYQWDPRAARLTETGPPAVAAPRGRAAAEPKRLANGLLPGHVITVDAGHGGIDPGNPGIYFPRGVTEKDVTLQMAILLRNELKERGVKVVMTRTTDTLIGFRDRARYCTAECDLFVSLHVDALPRSARARYRSVDGFHTIIIGEENTEDADRIARMENEALRFEEGAEQAAESDLDFILRNLQMNEYLRESARAAELVQDNVSKIHTGANRGVKQSKVLAVLNQARRPAILVEMGFSTNPSDARIMTQRKSQEAMASAIADAIVEYLRDYERKTGSPAGAP